MDKRVEFVHVDDWTVLYIDGIKAIENHSLHYTHVLDALDIAYIQRELELPKNYNDWDYFIEFADNVEDIKVEKYSDDYPPHYDDEVLN